MFLLLQVETKLYPTIDTIKIRIVIAWSWKKINCSIRGEAAFCKFSADQDEISKREISHIWSLNSLH